MIGSLMMCVSVVVLDRDAGRDRHGHPAKFRAGARGCASQSGRRRAAVPVRAVLPAGSGGVAVVLLKGPSFEAAQSRAH